MTDTPTEPSSLIDGTLYKALAQFLPRYTQNPFVAEPSLNVGLLHTELKKSHEAVYKWLRSSRLTPANATALVGLANRADNVKVLATMGRTPPKIDDFMPFVFA